LRPHSTKPAKAADDQAHQRKLRAALPQQAGPKPTQAGTGQRVKNAGGEEDTEFVP